MLPFTRWRTFAPARLFSLKAAGPKRAPMAATAELVEHDEDAAVTPAVPLTPPIGVDELQEAISRPPPMNSDYLPLPWRGRLVTLQSVHSVF